MNTRIMMRRTFFYDAPKPGSLPAGCETYSQLDNFKKLIKVYNGRDSNAVKYVEKVEAFIDKPLDELELKDVRAIMNEVKFPRKLDISVLYQLTGRLPHEGLELKDEDFIIHFYYSPPQRLEGNESPMFVDISGCVAAVAHRNFYGEVEHSNLCQIAFVLINIDYVLINMSP